LRYDEFYDAREFAVARKLLDHGQERAKQLAAGDPKWTKQTGLVVRGYRSKIDGSVQPFGLVVPASWSPTAPHKFRLDLWWHGRGEKLTELSFIQQRETQKGEFTPPDTIVLHPYGRYCNANKFAGEVDTFEATAEVKKHYRIDEDRIVARGFSMGGAACWQFATHFPSVWCAANPGAGFAETADFLKVFQNEKVQPTEWEQKLWRWYDATDYAGNLFNLPTVAYSGEIDKQKQAADMMAKAMKAEGLELTHLIGPGTAHKYHPETKKEVAAKIDALAAKGRPDLPEEVRFTTYTLRYPQSYWVRVNEVGRHWEKVHVDAKIDGLGKNSSAHRYPISIKTQNVVSLSLVFSSKWNPLMGLEPSVELDGQTLSMSQQNAVGPGVRHFRKKGDKWEEADSPLESGQFKKPGLQGPIDDTFMDRFLMVRPTGMPLNEKVGAWTKGEMAHAIKAWRDQFRGEAPVKDDTAVTDADIRDSNLILWGDPSSNKVLAKIAGKLPIPWDQTGVRFGPKIWNGENHVVLMIYPNPLNPNKYVVLNSGFTFREYDYLSNARQTPKLPDWAIVDVNTPPSPRWPGKVVEAGFFDEKWQWSMMR
ncbi:MAG TPA: prolyl oligopeptidase family serine peptidase, partial [Gemmataceae bacterium]|nr:prolyl oligopeptidase family serine peptidase [Gemmataceae bacterium]